MRSRIDHLISLYQQRLGLQEATFLLIEHEDAMVARVYRIAKPSGELLILKVCTRSDDYLREVYFLSHFAQILPVPHIVELVQPGNGLDGAILMEYLPGKLLTSPELTSDLSYEMGRLLAHIHQSRQGSYGDLIQPESLSPDPRSYFNMKFEEGLAECASNLPQEVIDQCRRYWDAHLRLLNAVDGPCIVHRDYRPGNLIMNEGKIQGIIDWSSARASFAEEDFTSMEHDGWPNKDSFLSGYAKVRPVPDYRAIMPLLRLSKAVATVGFTVKRGTWNKDHATIYRLNRHFLELRAYENGELWLGESCTRHLQAEDQSGRSSHFCKQEHGQSPHGSHRRGRLV